MKNYLLLTLTFLSVFSFAQNELKKDTLFLAKGGYLVQGQNIKLGKGTRDNGFFKNIEVSTSSMFRTIGNSNDIQGYNALASQYNNLEAKIIRFEDRGTKRTGKKYVAIIGVGEPSRYQVDIDNAIEDGEVILVGYKKENITQVPNSSISMIDELKKLKDLYDAGVLSEDEYNTAKTKILGKL